MMTSASDYKLYTPPAGVDIRGEIVPVADIDGRIPTIRREDVCYLTELSCVFRNSTSSTYFPKDNRKTVGLRGVIPCAGDSTWDGSKFLALKPDCPMNYSQSGTSFNEVTAFKAFASANDWFHTPTAAKVKAGAPIRADDIRSAYHFLGEDYYHVCYESSCNSIYPTGIIGCTVTPTEWTVPTHSVVNDELVTGTKTYSSHNNGSLDSFSLGGGTYLSRYDSDSRAYKYCTFLDVPSLPVSVPVSFAINATKAYALLSLSANTKYYKCVLREMTATESGFGLEVFNSSDLSYFLGVLGYSSADFDKWTTDSTSRYFTLSASIVYFFAKFGRNAYYALPADWNWSPSAN